MHPQKLDLSYLFIGCPALQELRDRYENLPQAPQPDAIFLFMRCHYWCCSIYIHMFRKRVHICWPPVGGQASKSPELTGKHLVILLLLLLLWFVARNDPFQY